VLSESPGPCDTDVTQTVLEVLSRVGTEKRHSFLKRQTCRVMKDWIILKIHENRGGSAAWESIGSLAMGLPFVMAVIKTFNGSLVQNSKTLPASSPSSSDDGPQRRPGSRVISEMNPDRR
jgi:hypothetical protein